MNAAACSWRTLMYSTAFVVVERVEHVEERRAHDAEDVLHLLRLEQLDDRAPGVQLGHHFEPSRSGPRN